MVGEVTEAGGTLFLQDPTGRQDTFLAGNNGAEQRLPAGLRPYTFHNWPGKPLYGLSNFCRRFDKARDFK